MYKNKERGVIYDRENTKLAYNVENPADDTFALRKYINLDGFANLLGYLKYPTKDKYGFYFTEVFDGVDNTTVATIINRGKQENNFGKDMLGVKGMKDTDKNESDSTRPKYKGNNPLTLENSKKSLIQNQKILSKLDELYDKKLIIFENNNISFMDEEQLGD